MKIIPKVLPCEQLTNLKGSPLVRDAKAAKLGGEFRKWTFDVLRTKQKENKPLELTLDEIKNFYKQKFPDINLEIGRNDDKSCGGSVRTMFDKKNNSCEFVMKLNFSNNKDGLPVMKKDDVYILFHEDRHFADNILNPKIVARPAFICFAIGDNKYKDIYKFYKKNLYCTKYYMENKIPIDEAITDFFEKQKLSSEEKINVLQDWRYHIKTEINANENEHILSYKLAVDLRKEKAKIKILNDLRNKISSYYINFKINFIINDLLLYPAKLKLLESMLAQEIKDHRVKHSESLRAKSSK